mmetsp:Transcript_20675/g.66543  ORF Transcript_20675/g.66543 Transcript_20675/m.66543 type:complete len:612 (-) Transcript_20675:398-2233(-)
MHRPDDRALVRVGHFAEVGELCAATPVKDEVDQAGGEARNVLVHIHRQLRLEHDGRHALGQLAHPLDRLAHLARADHRHRVLLLAVLALAAAAAEPVLRHEARQERGQLRGIEVLEEAREHELGHEQLVRGAHLARHPPLVADDAVLREVAEPAQHAAHAPQLLLHQRHLPLADLPLDTLLLLLRGAAQPQDRKPRRDLLLAQAHPAEPLLHTLEPACELGRLLCRRGHLEVLVVLQLGHAVGEAPLHLAKHLEHRVPPVAGAEVLRERDLHLREGVDAVERQRQHVQLRALLVTRGRRLAARLDGGLGARVAPQQHVDVVLVRRAEIVASPLALLLVGPEPLVAHDGPPSPLARLALLAGPSLASKPDQAAGLQKVHRLGVLWIREKRPQLLAQRALLRAQSVNLEQPGVHGEVGRGELRRELALPPLQVGLRLLQLEGVEGLCDQVLDVCRLGADAVEQHVVREVEARGERVRLASKHLPHLCQVGRAVDHRHDRPSRVEPPPARAAAHLDVLARGEVPEGGAVELGQLGEDDGLGGHVEAHGEGLGREEELDEPLLEEDLDELLEQRQEPRVVDGDAPLEQRQHLLDLRQHLVVVRQRLDGVFVDLRD